MRVDRAVRRVVDDPDSESLMISLVGAEGASGTQVGELAALTERGVQDFEARWGADFPGSFDAPPPVVSVAVVSPRVIVSLDKITDLPLSFDRLLAAWQPWLPATTRVQLPPKVRAPRPGQAVGQLVARCAVTAYERPPKAGMEPGWVWQLEPEREARVDAAVLSWLTGLGRGPHLFDQVGDRFLPVQDGDLADAWQRSKNHLSGHLVAVSGPEFRQVSMWRDTQHFSFSAGILTPDWFNPQASYDQLLELLRRLEPDLQMALVCYSAILDDVRYVHRLTGEFKARRNVARFDHERLYEDHGGIVDAQGVLLLADPPEGIDPSWMREPFGHLTLLTAPNLIEDWLAHGPDAATREQARTALAPLIRGYTASSIYYPDGKPETP